ncbi:MAG: helix-turn-helix domain-containing protein [bacterium]
MGERIKRNRKTKVMRLNELAKKVGVTVSLLSQIENGKAFPSIVTLKKIADSLDTTVGEIIGENEHLTDNPVVKNSDKIFVRGNSTGATLYMLSPHDMNKRMETYYISLDEKSDTGDMMYTHPGESFFHILKGSAEFLINEKKYQLKKGDSIYFNTNVNHSAKNINKKGKTEIVWVTTPSI